MVEREALEVDMATQLNIKDEQTVARARELARRSGQPVTAVIRDLVDTEWKKQTHEDFIAELDRVTAEFKRNMPEEMRGLTSKEIMDSIYVDGLPE
jgi:antitoxin VapB